MRTGTHTTRNHKRTPDSHNTPDKQATDLHKESNNQEAKGNRSPNNGRREDDIDYYKLAKAIGRHETGLCSLGYGATHNNATGIMRNGKPRYFSSCEASLQETVRIWKKYYGGLPTLEKAKKWSGNDRAISWLHNVLHFYNS